MTSKTSKNEVRVGKIGNVSGGSINIAGGDIDIRSESKLSEDDIQRLFRDIQKKLAELPEGTNQEEAQEAVNKIKVEAQKGEEADETRVQKWLNFLAETAPDVWEVAVETFLNPVKGVSLVFKKIAEHAQQRKVSGQ